MELGLTKYDDIDVHESSAIEAGHPRENAFTHIGLLVLDEPFAVACWAVDELVVSVGGAPADVEAAIARLP